MASNLLTTGLVPHSPPNTPPVSWPLLPVPDASGRLNFPALEASVRQQIQVILRTRPGEQLMAPGFGGGLEDFLHEPNTIVTRRRIHDTITDALGRWEPRIHLDRVDVLEVDGEPTLIRVELGYRLRRTGQPQQLGMTMELEG
ncbi:MAG: GPW/gp25 family protein [Caldilineaceae bacterium]